MVPFICPCIAVWSFNVFLNDRYDVPSISSKNIKYAYQLLENNPCDIVVPMSKLRNLFSSITGVLFMASNYANNSGIWINDSKQLENGFILFFW